MDKDQAIAAGLARYAQLNIGPPDQDVINDMEAFYRKSSEFRAWSDARGDFTSGLSVPEGTFLSLINARLPYYVQRKQPTLSDGGRGGSADLDYNGVVDNGFRNNNQSVVGVPVSPLQAAWVPPFSLQAVIDAARAGASSVLADAQPAQQAYYLPTAGYQPQASAPPGWSWEKVAAIVAVVGFGITLLIGQRR